MKTTTTKTWLAIYTSVLMATAGQNAVADQPAAAQPERTYTGTVVSVDPKEHLLNVKGWAFSKKEFNLGQNCAYVLLDKNPADIGDVRTGQKVSVSYQDSHGVLIAGRVQQEAMRYEGMVKAMDAEHHMLTLHASGSDRNLQLADDCQVVLRNGKIGAFPDIKVGSHVTVTYEAPGDKLTAYQIAQTSVEFTGTLTAIDLEARTVKAKATFASKKFNLADNCAIVINGKPDGRLGDLKPNDRLVFSYDEIDGINVANRIAPAEASPANTTNSVAATAPATY